jgi:Txe/YoeB family toxin of Txe-Axe toxin-antitoxin module
MEIEFTIAAEKDLKYWKKINDEAVLKRIRALL